MGRWRFYGELEVLRGAGGPKVCVCVFFAGFLLDKKIGVNQPKRLENVTILIANTGMDTDKIKVTEPDTQ
jgi:T-complex protein 1 subunit beta